MLLSVFSWPLHRVLFRRPLGSTLMSRLDWIVDVGFPCTGRLHAGGRLRRNYNSGFKGGGGVAREGKGTRGVESSRGTTATDGKELGNPEGSPGRWASGKRESPDYGIDGKGSDSLLSLLRSIGHAKDIPAKAPGKVNLSYVDPLNPRNRSGRGGRGRVSKRRYPGRGKSRYIYESRIRRERYSLKSITVNLIHHIYNRYPHSSFKFPAPTRENGLIEEHDEGVIRDVFKPAVRDYLEHRGYTPEDVLVWAWILTTKDGGLAGFRLDLGTRIKSEAADRSLEEQELPDAEFLGEADGIQIHGSDKDLNSGDIKDVQLSSSRNTAGAKHIYRIPPFLILFTLRRKCFIRDNIYALFPMIESTLLPSNGFSISDEKTTALLLLRLLRRVRTAWPPAIPMVAKLLVTHLHRPNSPAPRSPPRVTKLYNRLLTLLSLPTSPRPFAHLPTLQRSQFMILHKMAALNIPLTREGYRAIIMVQLAHAKTPVEKQTVRDMVTTWPPWPFKRDGRDARATSVSSRAAEVIQRMTEAGYPLLDWEHSALILAGRDTDNTPTIQTRTFHLKLRHLLSSSPTSLWASRIRATRTLDEAWSIFLQCRQGGTIPRRDTWEELFAKVLFAAKLSRQQIQANLGDQKLSPHERSRLEVIRHLQKETNYRVVAGDAREILPPPRNIGEGVYVPIPPPDVDELCMMMKRDNVPPSHRLLAQLLNHSRDIRHAHWILETWNHPLPSETSKKTIDPRILTAYISLLLHRKHDQIEPAIRLLLAHKPTHIPAYNAVLTRLIRTLDSKKAGDKPHRIRLIWGVYKKMTQLVSEDSETLRALCVAAEKNIRLGARVLWDGLDPVDRIVRIFEQNIGLHHRGVLIAGGELPPLLTPTPATTHAYVRLLGFSRRYEEVRRIIRWVATRADWLDDRDKPMARRVVVAARVFLEVPGDRGESVRVDVLRDVKGLVQDWPSDDEVAEYCLLGGLKK